MKNDVFLIYFCWSLCEFMQHIRGEKPKKKNTQLDSTKIFESKEVEI